jgi:hypothetical protein
LGITRIKNQISDKRPTTGNSHINQGYFLKRPVRLPGFGQVDETSLFFPNGISKPP